MLRSGITSCFLFIVVIHTVVAFVFNIPTTKKYNNNFNIFNYIHTTTQRNYHHTTTPHNFQSGNNVDNTGNTDNTINGKGPGFVDCRSIAEYITLTDLVHNDDCATKNSMFSLLEAVRQRSEHCMDIAIKYLAHSIQSSPSSCQCTGGDKLTEYHQYSMHGLPELYMACFHFPSYMSVFNQFFNHRTFDTHLQCETHHSLWRELNALTHSRTCLDDIVRHVNHKYRHEDPCSCTVQATPVAPTVAPSSVPTTAKHVHCEDIPTYNTLMLLGRSDLCLSANSVWHYLDEVEIVSDTCRRKLVDSLAATFQHKTLSCDCQPTTELIDQSPMHLDNGSYTECLSVRDSTYDDISSVLFSQTKENGCQDHSYVWTKLADVHSYHSPHNHWDRKDCTKDLIIRASLQYKKNSDDPCVCSKKTTTLTAPQTTPTSTTTTTPIVSTTISPVIFTTAPTTAKPTSTQSPTTSSPTTQSPTTPNPTTQSPTTPNPTTQSPTTPNPTTQSPTTPNPTTQSPTTQSPTTQSPTTPNPTTQSPTTQTAPTQQSTTNDIIVTATTPTGFACDTNKVLLDMATATVVKSPLAVDCTITGNDEALAITECHLQASSTWKKGANILQDCQSGSPSIPIYTPIATFTNDTYISSGGHSAIFVGCTIRGFNAVVQYCGKSPLVVEASLGINYDQYHTIV